MGAMQSRLHSSSIHRIYLCRNTEQWACIFRILYHRDWKISLSTKSPNISLIHKTIKLHT